MDDQFLNWLIFLVTAALLVVIVIGIVNFWDAQLNLSEDDIEFERRMSALNEQQANRRRDDEIIRLLSGDEQRTVGDRDDR